MSKVPNHLHRYKKVNLGNNGKQYWVYRCMRAGCAHYIPVHLSEGKLCECNKCGEPMVINKETLSGAGGRPLAKPRCINCIERKKNPEAVDKIAEYIHKVEIED